MALANQFDTSAPPDTGESPRLGASRIRELKNAVQERMNDHNGAANQGDHFWPKSGSQVSDNDTGQHRMLTLRQMAANPSTLGSYAVRTDLGWIFQKDVGGNGELFWQDEAANVIQISSGGKLLGDAVRWSNNTYLVAKNAAGTGTVNLIKANASDKAEIADGAVLASSAAPTIDAGIANKKYVDDQVNGLMITPAKVTNIFGGRESRTHNTEYTAATDGIVTATCRSHSWIRGFIKIDGAGDEIRVAENFSYQDTPGNGASICFPVRKGDKWRVHVGGTGSTTLTLYWLPIGV